VGGEVVADQVHVQVGGDLAVDGVEECAELDRAVLVAGLGDDLSGGHLERGEQVGAAGPTTSRTFSTNCGSLDSLKVS
jgi:hypothetical protein